MAASQTMPALPPNRRGVVGQWIVLAGAAIAIAVIVALIVTWPDHDTGSQGAAGPSAGPAKEAGKTPSQAAAVRP
jgi:hypothetical protein